MIKKNLLMLALTSLFFSMDLVEVIGKRNRKVPILLTPAIRKGIDLLVATREEVGISLNNPYVFAKVLRFK